MSSTRSQQGSVRAGGSMSVTGSEQTEPMEYYEEDVFVANLEDPAKKYASLTKRASVAKAAAATAPIPEEEERPPSFFGSKLMWLGLCWCILIIVVIVVAVRAASGDDDPAPAPSVAPAIPDAPTVDVAPTAPEPTIPSEPEPTVPVEPTDPPTASDVIVEPNVTVTVAPTDDVDGTTDAPDDEITDVPVVVTEAPTDAPIATAEPTDSPDDTTVPTGAPTIATAAPTIATDAPTIATDAPTVATEAPVAATAEPTDAPVETAEPAEATESPTAAPVPEVPVETDAPTPRGPVDLLGSLPSYTQEALQDPTSPQSFAFLFVNYDPNFDTRTSKQLVQRFALATLYFGLGRSWTNGAVLPAQDECLWFEDTGSFCNDDGGMEALLLSANNLEGGPIPPEIGLLTDLKQVDMSSNFITGTIPTYFGQLPILETLSLAQNELIMVPTELAAIPTLQTLDLTGLDSVTGVIPEGLCDVEALLFDCSESLCGCDCACAR